MDAKLLSMEGGPVLQIGKELTFGYPGRFAFPESPAGSHRKTDARLARRVQAAEAVRRGFVSRPGHQLEGRLRVRRERERHEGRPRRLGDAREPDGRELPGRGAQARRRRRESRARRGDGHDGDPRDAKVRRRWRGRWFSRRRPLRIPPLHARTANDRARQGAEASDAARSPEHRRQKAPDLLRPTVLVSRTNRRASENQKVGVFLDFENAEKNRLGMPLPKGILRVYKADKSGSKQFVGEDSIDHTPRDERVRVKMGEAFDVVADRKQMEWRALGGCVSESAWQIELRNHKDEAVKVEIREPAGGDWTIARVEPPCDQRRREHLHLRRSGTETREDAREVPRPRALVLRARPHAARRGAPSLRSGSRRSGLRAGSFETASSRASALLACLA